MNADILSGAASRLVASLAESVGSGARLFEATLKSKTPRNRVKTRRYTTSIHRKGELQAVAGVIFPSGSRFRSEGTVTRSIVDRVYESDGQKILDHIASQMVAAIDQQSLKTIEIGKG
jgi:hypothetical protein